MSNEALTPEILRGGEVERRRFDPRTALPFVNKSVSEETRRAYRRAVSEFFQFVGMKHPSEVVLVDVQLWRDRLRAQRKSAATVAFKLSVVRSFFKYLKAAGAVPLNPASTKLVSPPELPSEPAGHALSAREVPYLLSGPDRGKPEGARDYALMLVMLRLSLRVSEVCSLRTSSLKWSHGRWTLRCKAKGGREEVWPLPKDVKEALDNYLRLDSRRRQIAHSGGDEAYLFQPHTNYRTLDLEKPHRGRALHNRPRLKSIFAIEPGVASGYGSDAIYNGQDVQVRAVVSPSLPAAPGSGEETVAVSG